MSTTPKYFISLNKTQLHRIANFVKEELLGNPIQFGLVSDENNNLVIWKRSLLLQTVLEQIIQEYFVCHETLCTIDMDDWPKALHILDADIIWLNNTLKSNPLFPFMFEISREEDGDFFFKSTYTKIVDPSM